MLRITLLSVLILVSLSSSSASILQKSISRRQTDQPYCSAIEGFECKCSYFRVTCTTDRDLPSPLIIIQSEEQKYQSIELVISAPRDIKVTDRTFEPVKALFKPDGDTFEFRIKFEKFTGLQLSSPGIFNRVYPDNMPLHARKHMALEIYNPEVAPSEDLRLFQNLNADALEVYALYPFHGSFQQLFDGANIKYLRLSGGDVRSDLSQPFTGNIGRLELAKQASALSAQNFPVYPAHEMIINAFYITEFNTDHPPNYSNLVELRVYSPERIPANAFQQFPNIHTLSVSTDKDIDPHALHGLNNLEKLSVKESKPSLTLLNSVPSVKEFETNIEKLDEDAQCRLAGKLADGQVAVQGIPNGRECNCVTAYLNTVAGRTACEVKDCERSTCDAIRNNYDETIRAFKALPTIRRTDGTDAFRQREPPIYTTTYQVSPSDREKLQRAIPQQTQQTQPEDDAQRPSGVDQGSEQPEQPHHQPDSQDGQDRDSTHDDDSEKTNQGGDNQQDGKDQENQSGTDTSGNQTEKEGSENQADGQDGQSSSQDSNTDTEGNTAENSQTPPKKGMKWLPIIIIIAAIVAVLVFGLIFYFSRRKGSSKGYSKAEANDPAAAANAATTRA